MTHAFWLTFRIVKNLTITLFDLWLTLSDYPLVFWKFWPLHCLNFDLRFGILKILTITDYPLLSWKFWPLHCLIFDFLFLLLTVLTITLFDLWLALSYLDSFDHYIVWSLTHAFWLPFGILKVLTITLFDLWLTLSDYPLVSWKFWPLNCLIFDTRFLINLSYREKFDHYIVWSLTYAFWLPFGILKILTITLFQLWLTLSDYPLLSWKFWPLHCLIFDLRFLILTVLTITLFDLWHTLSDYPLVSWKFWPLHCLIFDLRFLITLWYLDRFDNYSVVF